MAYSYSQLKEIQARIIVELSQQQAAVANGIASFTVAKAKLTTMQQTYAGWKTEVDALATANPSDEGVLALKAEADLLVAEFASLKSTATALEAAVNE